MPISEEHTLHPKVAYSDTRRSSGFSLRQKGRSNERRLSLIVKQNKKKKPQEKIDKHKEDWADDVIKIFTVPERKRHLQDEQGLVSIEESLERITFMLIFAACLLLLIATIMLAHMDFNAGININAGITLKSRVPHIFIIYQDGLHLDFSTDEKISTSKNFDIKLRHSLPSYSHSGIQTVHFKEGGKSTGYLAYANDNRIYIFYTDGQKDVTYIDIETGKHRTISNTAYGANLMFGSGIRVGNKFFMTGDKIEKFSGFLWTDWSSQCFTWMEKREFLDRSKRTKLTKYTNTCFTSYNRQVH